MSDVQNKKPGPKPKSKAQRIRSYSVALKGSQIESLERLARVRGVNTSEYIRILLDADIKAQDSDSKEAI